MIDPIAVGLTRVHVCNDDCIIERDQDKKIVKREPKPNATKWTIGALESFLQAMIEASSSANLSVEVDADGKQKFVKSKDEYTSIDFIIVSHGLKGFENFGDIEFRTEKQKLFDREVEVVPMEILNLIPLRVIHELADEIWLNNKVDEELEKN